MKLRLAALVLATFLTPLLAGAQCALCYEAAKHAGANSQRALRRGIIVLLVPPLVFGGLIVGFAFRTNRKDQI